MKWVVDRLRRYRREIIVFIVWFIVALGVIYSTGPMIVNVLIGNYTPFDAVVVLMLITWGIVYVSLMTTWLLFKIIKVIRK